MNADSRAPRDREVMRYMRQLFWRAALRDKRSFWWSHLTHVPVFIAQNVLVPIGIAYGIQAIVTRRFDQVPEWALFVVLVTVVYNLINWVATRTYNAFSVKAGAYVQQAVFANYLQKHYDFYANSFYGSLGAQAARIRDAATDYNLIVFFEIPRQATNIGFALIVIAWQSVPLALLTLACMGLTLSVTIASSALRLKYRRAVSEASSEIAGAVGDALSHASTVKSFATETDEENRLRPAVSAWQSAQLKSWNLFTPANTARTMLGALTIAGLLLATAHLYQGGAISIATVALVQIYVIRMIGGTIEIAEIIKNREAVLGAAYQPIRTMLVETQVKDKAAVTPWPKTARLTIRFEDVGFQYPEAAKRRAVSGFDLEIQPGQKVGLVGYSGSGKTTLTKLLLRFMDVTEGRITIGGVDIRDVAQADLRRAVAYVPQEPLLFHRTIAQNIAYARPKAGRRTMLRAAKLAYVDEFAAELPQGYDTYVGERGVKLSGGQRQRVAIARALLKDAPILVLDEATSALDSHSEKRIQRALWRLMEDRTALVIAHRLSTIQRMDVIVVMDKGRIVQAGAHQELLKDKDGIYARLWAHQSGGYLDPGGSSESQETER